MKKYDKIILIVLASIFLGSFLIRQYIFNQKNNLIVNIYVDNKLYKKTPLDKTSKRIININTQYGKNKVLIDNKGVRIIESNCKNKICVKTGYIKYNGQSIICLPHKVYIEIVSNQKEKLDELSY